MEGVVICDLSSLEERGVVVDFVAALMFSSFLVGKAVTSAFLDSSLSSAKDGIPNVLEAIPKLSCFSSLNSSLDIKIFCTTTFILLKPGPSSSSLIHFKPSLDSVCDFESSVAMRRRHLPLGRSGHWKAEVR